MEENNASKLIKAMEKRLRWYMLEASEEEFDAEEVDFIIAFLKAVVPIDVDFEDTEIAYKKLMKRIEEEPDAEEGHIWIGGN